MSGPARLRVLVTAQQPLALGTGSEVAFFTNSHPYAPGSVLRGALAAAWIAEYGPPDRAGTDVVARFRRLFDGAVRFGPLLPEGSYRVPLSVRRCKYPRTDPCQRYALDLAFEDAAVGCPGCGRRPQPSRGTLVLPGRTALRRTTRTSIDPDTGRAKEHELYAHGALPAGTVLIGEIVGEVPEADAAWLRAPRALRLGGRRTVGGLAAYRIEPEPGAATASGAAVAPGGALESGAAPGPTVSGDRLVLRLVSPAIFVDLAGRPCAEPHPELDLDAGPEADAAGVATLRRRWVRSGTWSGWHAASKLPKPVEFCAEAGSTYLFQGEPAALTALARRAVADGIGLRRAEGFGVVEMATKPWRPPADETPTGTAGTDHAEAVRARQWLDKLALTEAYQRDWLTGVFRRLQLAASGTGQVSEKVVEDLLTEPTAGDLSGRQRDLIRAGLTGRNVDELRDLTTLALADRRKTDTQ